MCNCNSTPCCCAPRPPACNCPPSPLPPWARPTQSPLVQTLSDNTVPLVLDPDITYLAQTQQDGAPITNNMVLPNGNFLKQMKRLYIPGQTIATTATWIIAGTFAGGFTKLQFDRFGFSAFLEWDGAAWQLVGGNATLVA